MPRRKFSRHPVTFSQKDSLQACQNKCHQTKIPKNLMLLPTLGSEKEMYPTVLYIMEITKNSC